MEEDGVWILTIPVNGDTLTIAEGNLDGKTNTFKEAQRSHTKEYTLSQLRTAMQGSVCQSKIKGVNLDSKLHIFLLFVFKFITI